VNACEGVWRMLAGGGGASIAAENRANCASLIGEDPSLVGERSSMID
jgi:hypothetical protein